MMVKIRHFPSYVGEVERRKGRKRKTQGGTGISVIAREYRKMTGYVTRTQMLCNLHIPKEQLHRVYINHEIFSMQPSDIIDICLLSTLKI